MVYKSTLRSRRKRANRLKILSNNELGIVFYQPSNAPAEVLGDMVRKSTNDAFLLELEIERNKIHVPDSLKNTQTPGAIYFYTALAKAIKESDKDYLTFTRQELADMFDVNVTSTDRWKHCLIKGNYIRYLYSKKDKTYKLYINCI